MSALLRRILFVGLALILSFEIVCQLEVHWNWRESAGELAQLLVYGFLLLGVIWAVLPALSSHDSRLLRGLERSVILGRVRGKQASLDRFDKASGIVGPALFPACNQRDSPARPLAAVAISESD
jgi:hypothetical protein